MLYDDSSQRQTQWHRPTGYEVEDLVSHINQSSYPLLPSQRLHIVCVLGSTLDFKPTAQDIIRLAEWVEEDLEAYAKHRHVHATDLSQ